MISKYLSAVLFVVLPYLAPAQPQRLGNIDDFIAKQVVDYKMPGLAVGVIHDHKVLFRKGYGTTSRPNGRPVDTQTVFPISFSTTGLLPAKEPFSGYLYASGEDTLTLLFNDPFVPPGEVIFECGTDKKVKRFKLNIDSQDFLFGDLDFRSLFSPL